jgi:hypothetical protein
MSTATGSFNELFEQAARVFENGLRAGTTMQQETTKWFAETLRAVGSAQQWQVRNQAAIEQAMSTFQKNVDAGLKMMNENAKTSLELLERAFDARPIEPDPDSHARSREMWETAMGALRKNMQMMVEANARVVESWGGIVRVVCSANECAQKAEAGQTSAA